MPFEKIYVLNLKNGNLKPSINLLGWGTVDGILPPSDPLFGKKLAVYISDPPIGVDNQGMTFETTRTDAISRANNGIFVNLNDTLPIESRILVELTFDLPKEMAGSPLLWGVTADIANDKDSLASSASVVASCQFNRRNSPTGVRLNTPSSMERAQDTTNSDQAAFLDSPLNLPKYVPGPTRFTLSLSFCGVKANCNANTSRCHISGNTTLKIKDKNKGAKDDHRIYSSNVLNAFTSIGVVGAGVSVGTNSIATVRARLRTFTVRINRPLIIT